jgi:serine/threonine-protein kinase
MVMPPSIDPSRDLLFGLLALQNGLINQAQLVAAFQAWTLDKARALADHLIALGHLTGAQQAVIEAMADLHIAKHGDLARSLAAIPAGRSTQESLSQLGDPDIEGTLAHVRSQSTQEDGDTDANRTATYSVGSATSDGLRFRVLRPHARGGLGAVFVALDTELHREVALKQILDSHADDAVSRQRFILEAEVTGGLEHPGIVPVYGLGTYEDGRPYYAMRFIRGDSLKEAIDRFHADKARKSGSGSRSLELRKLLRRSTDVCNAIEYAHSRSVLHRDIKPGNVIVGRHGETLVVDWGLAKVLGKDEGGRMKDEKDPDAEIPASSFILRPSSLPSETLAGSALGTPAYMSPEQAEGDLEHLSPRSDVYSLGATLYYLLTGCPPAEGGDAGEVLRAVKRGEFRAPRERDATIDRALEAVCLKAMANRPEDRYPSARALAEDLDRWMADEPVSAWREPVSRRMRRWMQRNRTTVAAAVVALVVGVIGLAAVTGVQARANSALRNANDATKAALAETKAAKEDTDAALTRAEASARRAQANAETARRETRRADDNAGLINGALGRLVQRVGTDPGLRAAGLTAFREELLRDAVGMYDELARRNPGEGTLGLGEALKNQGLIQYLLGEFSQAIASHLRAESVLAALVPTYASRLALAGTRKQIGVIYAFAGRPAEGLTKTRDAVTVYQALIRERPSDQDARFQLALATVNLGNFARQRDPDSAIAHYREALVLTGALRAESPANPRYTEWEARTTSNLGLMLCATGKIEAGVVAQRQAVALAEQLTDDFQRLDALAMCRNNLAEALEQAKRSTEADTIFRQSLKDYRTLAGRFPNDVDYPWGVAMTLSNLAAIVFQHGRLKEARELIHESGKIFDELRTRLGTNADFQQHQETHTRIRNAIKQSMDSQRP